MMKLTFESRLAGENEWVRSAVEGDAAELLGWVEGFFGTMNPVLVRDFQVDQVDGHDGHDCDWCSKGEHADRHPVTGQPTTVCPCCYVKLPGVTA